MRLRHLIPCCFHRFGTLDGRMQECFFSHFYCLYVCMNNVRDLDCTYTDGTKVKRATPWPQVP